MARSLARKQLDPAQSLAELLSDLGHVLRRQVYRRAGIEVASVSLPSLRWESRLALQFVTLSPAQQFRALMEDWPLHRIKEAVQAQGAKVSCAG